MRKKLFVINYVNDPCRCGPIGACGHGQVASSAVFANLAIDEDGKVPSESWKKFCDWLNRLVYRSK